jgi:ribosomal protein L3 glutamine methyltransferase
MAKKTKTTATRGAKTRTAAKAKAARTPKPVVAPGELRSLRDLVRFAVSRCNAAGVVFAHGTTDPVAEAAFLVCEALHLHPDQFDLFADARVTAAEAKAVLALIERRVTTRKPAAYLVNKVYMRGLPFYVDERVIVPRSFIGELLDSHFSGDGESVSLIEDPLSVTRVLDLCTGSGCLAILAALHFPDAMVDAVDISRDALAVAARNVAGHGLEDRVTLYQGNLFEAVGEARYDLIITNPPYVDAEDMEDMPPEYLFEPRMALAAGDDGLDIVHRILKEAPLYMNDGAIMVLELGYGGEALQEAYPDTPFNWMDTENSTGEVFWITKEQLEAL